MKTSKLFITSLLAAAAMSATAYGDQLGNYTFSGVSGHLGSSGTAEISDDFIFEADSGSTPALTIDNGWNAGNQLYSGKWTGSGTFKIAVTAAASGQDYRVSGNLTEYTGNIVVSGMKFSTGVTDLGTTNESVLQFGNAAAYVIGGTNGAAVSTDSGSNSYVNNIVGTGSITSNTVVRFNYAAADSTYSYLKVSNTSISARYLDFRGGANYTVSSTVTGNNATAANNTLKISAGTTTFTGSIANFGTITVASGATLSLSGAKVSLVNAIANSGKVNVDAATKFVLASLTGGTTSGNQTTYLLVNGGTLGSTWTSLNASNLDFAGSSYFQRGASATFANDGSMTVTDGTAGDLVWVGGENGAGTWNYSTTNTPWTNSGTATSFMNRDDVTFAGNATVTVDAGGVTANIVKISSGTVSFSGGTVTASALAGSGTIQLDSLTGLSVGTANDANRFTAWTGTVAFKNISDVNNVGLTLSDYGSKIRFDGLEGRVTTTGASGLWFGNETVNADIEIASGGLRVTNGTTSFTTTFAGKLTGAGTFEYTRAVGQTFKFTGNFSEFTGTLKSSDVATGFFELANAGDMTFNGNFDNANFRKSAAGVLTIANAGTFKNIQQNDGGLEFSGSGTTTIGSFEKNGGGLKFSGSGTTTIGLFKTTGSTNNVVTIDSGATLDVTTWNQAYTISTLTVNGDLNVSGVMTLATGGETNNITGTGNLTVGTLTTYNVGTYVFSGVNLKIGSGGITAGTRPLSFGQMIIGVKDGVTSWTAARGFTLTAASGTTFCPTEKAQSINLQGAIDGSGKLVKTGAGTLTLSKANTYAGGTTIEGGRLVAANAGALGSGTTKVERGAELGLVAGTAVKVTNGIDLASGAKLVIDMTGVVAGSEEIVLTLISNTALKYNETAFDPDCTSLLGSVVVLENLSGTLSAWTQSLSYSGNTLQLTMAIPEPSAFGLLAGLGALALAGTRRRRKKA